MKNYYYSENNIDICKITRTYKAYLAAATIEIPYVHHFAVQVNRYDVWRNGGRGAQLDEADGQLNYYYSIKHEAWQRAFGRDAGSEKLRFPETRLTLEHT